MSRQQAVVESAAPTETQARIWDAFRRWGYLQANLDPLGDLQPVELPELAVSGRDAEAARKIYCGTIGVEFMHIPDPERRRWIEERMESEAPTSISAADQKAILDRLVRAEIFEQVLQTRYLGTKRYSLEGESALLPLLDAILNAASEHDAQQAVLAMSHRGRLNVMVHIVGRPAAEVFAKFEDVDPRSVLGGGDVKYHIGATGEFPAANRRNVGNSPGIESEPSRSRGSCRHRTRPREAEAHRRRRHAGDRSGHHARRRCLCRTGNLG